MSTEPTAEPRPARRTGPHAPLPNAEPAADQAAGVVPVEEDPRVLAARRAEQILEQMGTSGDPEDKFYVDPTTIPDGWTYEWKNFEVLGKQDPAYQVELAQTGWEPVPRSRHPNLMPDGFHGDCIIRKGLILMQRPKQITDMVRAREQRAARDQVRAKELQATGHGDPGTLPRTPGKISKTIESQPIPDK